MAQIDYSPSLLAVSNGLAALVQDTAKSVVRVEDGSRLTATGVVWSQDGIVVTTSHGVERDEDLAIEFNDGPRLAATLVGRDADTDLAVLKVDSTTLEPIKRASDDSARVGSLALAVARPGRSGIQATLGVVSGRTETQSGGRHEYLLHTDADMYPGFSGGPLVDVEGNLIGLINLMFGRGRGIALGTPIVANITDSLLANGRVQRGYLGIRTQQVALPPGICATLPWAQDRGLLIAQVEPGSPADTAGLLLGDTVLRMGDVVIQDVDVLRRLLRQHGPGVEVAIEFLRGGEIKRVMAMLGAE